MNLLNSKLKIFSDFETIQVYQSKWGQFIIEHPIGSIFQSPEMYKLYLESDCWKPLALLAVSNETIQGVLLAVLQKEGSGLFGKLTSRAIIWGGPLVHDSDVAMALLQEYNHLVRSKVIYSQFRNLFMMNMLKNVFKEAGCAYEEHLNILIDLTQGEEILWQQIHKNRKKEIKNGLKKGLEVQQLNLLGSTKLSEIYIILKELYQKVGLPLPTLTFFEKAVLALESKNILKTFAAVVESKIVGFRMVLAYNHLIYDWYAASDNNYLSYRPNDVLPWEIFKWGCNNGFHTFDFGGAGKPSESYGVRDYKIKFGGTLVNYGRYVKVHNHLIYHTMKSLYLIWRRFRIK